MKIIRHDNDSIEYLRGVHDGYDAGVDDGFDAAREVLGQEREVVEEVKHGEWIIKGQDIFCSECGEESLYNPFGASVFSKRCPNCGAKMDGETGKG